MKRRILLAVVAVATALGLAAVTSTAHAQTWESSEQWGMWQDGEYTLYNNIWGSGAGTQTIWADSHSDWGVIADHPNTGGIKSYPNASRTLGLPITQMGQVTSDFDVTVPTSGVAFNSTYDIWGNGHEHEIMVWMNYYGPVGPLGAYETTVSVGGHEFDYYRGNNGANEVYSFLRTSNTSSGTVDITGIATWLHDTGRIPDVRIDQIQFGYEITSAAGGQEFVTNSYEVDFN